MLWGGGVGQRTVHAHVSWWLLTGPVLYAPTYLLTHALTNLLTLLLTHSLICCDTCS